MTDDQELDYVLGYEYSIRLTRIIDSAFYPSKIKIKIAYVLLEDKDIEKSFQTVNTWLNHIDYSLCMNIENFEKIKIECKNNIITCPEDPTDDLFCALLHSKVSTLLDSKAEIISLKYKSDTSNGLRLDWIGSTKHFLPQTSEYVQNSVWKKPWWLRNDLLSIDIRSDQDIPSSCLKVDLSNESHNNSAEIIKPFFPKTIKDD